MPIRRVPLFIPAILTALAGLLPGCSGTEAPEAIYRTTVVAVDARSSVPVTGVELFLVEAGTGRVAGGPAPVDENGSAGFTDLPAGDYVWFVRRGAGWEPAGLPPRAELFRTDRPAPAHLPAFGLLPTPPGGTPRISGRVIDAGTGEPLPGAVIGLPGWPDRWDGVDPPTGDVTAADGTFLLHDVPFAEDPTGEGPPFQIQPLIFQAEGYAPVSRRFDAPGFQFQEIAGVTVRLTRLDAGGTGALAGRVTHRNAPVIGASVAATWLGPAAKSGLAHPGLTAVTDPEGRYRFEGLAVGVWLLEAGFLPEDAWITPRSLAGAGGVLPVAVAAAETTAVADLPVLAAVVASFPRPGAQRVDSLPTFRWRGVAAADSYRVYLDRGIAGVTAAESLALDPARALGEGNHLWWVVAETAAGEAVGVTDAYQLFRVGPFD